MEIIQVTHTCKFHITEHQTPTPTHTTHTQTHWYAIDSSRELLKIVEKKMPSSDDGFGRLVNGMLNFLLHQNSCGENAFETI